MLKFLQKFNPGWKAALMAGLCGLAMVLAFPPFNLWFLGPLCLLPLWRLSATLPPARAFIAGWLWGIAQFMGGMYWLVYVMTSYGGMPLPLALFLLLLLCLYLGVYIAVLCWLLSRLYKLKIPMWLCAPLLWVGLEFLRGMALTGFPWLSLSLSLSSQPVLLQSAEIWGAIGLSFFVALFSVLLAYSFGMLPKAALSLPGDCSDTRQGKPSSPAMGRRVVCLGLAVIMAACFWGGGSWLMKRALMSSSDAPQALVSVVQGNIPLERLWLRANRTANVMEQLSLTNEASGAAEPDRRIAGDDGLHLRANDATSSHESATVGPAPSGWLVLWSESAAPFIFLQDVENSMPVLQQAASLRAWIALGTTGVETADGKPGYTNRMFLVDPSGQPYDHYDKVHLVPFGEYVPLAKVLFFVRAIAALSVDMIPGQAGKTLRADQINMGPLICYESIFPELARQHKLNGANLLVNPTNDAWFGPTGATEQHLGQLVMRAVENRLATARAANTGVSCFILPTGQVIEKTEIFTKDARTAWLPLWQSPTIFSIYGEVAGGLGLVFTILAFIYTIIASYKRKHNAG